MNIFTVSTLALHPNDPRIPLGEHRTWGFYLSFDEARKGMMHFCDSEAGYYTHAVIELVSPGIMPSITEVQWFQRGAEDTGWVECEKPLLLCHIIHWSMG